MEKIRNNFKIRKISSSALGTYQAASEYIIIVIMKRNNDFRSLFNFCCASNDIVHVLTTTISECTFFMVVVMALRLKYKTHCDLLFFHCSRTSALSSHFDRESPNYAVYCGDYAFIRIKFPVTKIIIKWILARNTSTEWAVDALPNDLVKRSTLNTLSCTISLTQFASVGRHDRNVFRL